MIQSGTESTGMRFGGDFKLHSQEDQVNLKFEAVADVCALKQKYVSLPSGATALHKKTKLL